MIIIGDVHGKKESYLKIIEREEASIQVGDMDSDYSFLQHVSLKHLFFKGNHDNYDKDVEQDLGHYGPIEEINNSFFMRGAFSIDRHRRVNGVSWWPDEELSYVQCSDAINDYKHHKPKIMLSHDCPQSVMSRLFGHPERSLTRMALDEMFEYCKPDLWIFGHHHQSKNEVIKGTNFICLDELETFRL